MIDPHEVTLDEAREWARAVLRTFPRRDRLQAQASQTTKGAV